MNLKMKPVITLDLARNVVKVAKAQAAQDHLALVIVILDDGGNLLTLDRMDGVGLASLEIAVGKAKTAVQFKAPSEVFEDGLRNGNLSLLKLDIVGFGGGMPLMVNGALVGAIGVSGAAASEADVKVAAAAVAWFDSVVAPAFDGRAS